MRVISIRVINNCRRRFRKHPILGDSQIENSPIHAASSREDAHCILRGITWRMHRRATSGPVIPVIPRPPRGGSQSRKHTYRIGDLEVWYIAFDRSISFRKSHLKFPSEIGTSLSEFDPRHKYARTVCRAVRRNFASKSRNYFRIHFTIAAKYELIKITSLSDSFFRILYLPRSLFVYIYTKGKKFFSSYIIRDRRIEVDKFFFNFVKKVRYKWLQLESVIS